MRNHEEARRVLVRLIREYKTTPDEERDHTTFRNLVYAFTTVLAFFKFQEDLNIEAEIETIKKRLEEKGI